MFKFVNDTFFFDSFFHLEYKYFTIKIQGFSTVDDKLGEKEKSKITNVETLLVYYYHNTV
jgi:hypothetical protein